MQIATLTDFRRHMKSYFEKVLQSGRPLFISRPKGKDVVIMSRSEYQSMQETFHLLQSPKNAQRLQAAIEADKRDELVLREIEG